MPPNTAAASLACPSTSSKTAARTPAATPLATTAVHTIPPVGVMPSTAGTTTVRDNTFLGHACQFRNQMITGWIVLILLPFLLLNGSLKSRGTAYDTSSALGYGHQLQSQEDERAFQQGCSSHCTSYMPHVCQQRYQCHNFCTENYFASRSVAIVQHANGDHFLSSNGVSECQPRCEQQREAVCSGLISCQRFCDLLRHGESPAWGWNVLFGVLFMGIELLPTCVLVADLLCSWLRFDCAYSSLRKPSPQRSRGVNAPFPGAKVRAAHVSIDVSTFRCGLVILMRSVLECHALASADHSMVSVSAILMLLQMDELLQTDAPLLRLPRGILVLSLWQRPLRAIWNRYAGTGAYSVPFATLVNTDLPMPSANATTATTVPSRHCTRRRSL